MFWWLGLWTAFELGLALAAPSPERSLTFRVKSEPQTLDWQKARSSDETYFLINIMEGLFEYDANLQPVPRIAESYELSTDRLVYTIKLKKNILWSDGRELVAEDFVRAWSRLTDPKVQSPYAQWLYGIKKQKKNGSLGFRSTGKYEIKVRLERPIPHFLHLLTFWVTFPIHPKGPQETLTLGPYRLKKWEKGQYAELESNPNYHDKKRLSPDRPNRVRMVFQPLDEDARTLFKKNETDLLLNANTSDILQHRMANQQIQKFPYLALYYLGFNLKSKNASNIHFRKAIMHSIDITQLSSILQGGQRSATSLVPPEIRIYPSDGALKYSSFLAKRQLVQAGYPEAKNAPALTVWIKPFDGAQKLGLHLKENLKRQIGIELKTLIGPIALHQKGLEDGSIDLFVNHWGADFPEPINFFKVFMGESPLNRTRWKSPQYDQWIKQADVAPAGTREKAFQEAEKILIQTEAMIQPLFYPTITALLSSRVESLYISPLNYFYFHRVKMKTKR